MQPNLSQPYPIQAIDPSAGIMRRLIAMVYDLLVVLGLLFFVLAIVTGINGMEAVEGPAFQSLIFLVIFGFFAIFWTYGGQTAGMKAWRLRVETLDGRPITLQQSLVRFLAAILSAACLGLGYAWLFFDKDKVTWHEKISGTRTVVLPKPEK
ncbi:RDD family protein [Litoribrevibacter euphylliae]|uniref:RDD family protein n=1 Tax=Litoribrevibacter euphylliae TaxID=1834034 RepID=A0ABV7H8E8_9GAMM